jgi:hypothetical protein
VSDLPVRRTRCVIVVEIAVCKFFLKKTADFFDGSITHFFDDEVDIEMRKNKAVDLVFDTLKGIVKENFTYKPAGTNSSRKLHLKNPISNPNYKFLKKKRLMLQI